MSCNVCVFVGMQVHIVCACLIWVYIYSILCDMHQSYCVWYVHTACILLQCIVSMWILSAYVLCVVCAGMCCVFVCGAPMHVCYTFRTSCRRVNISSSSAYVIPLYWVLESFHQVCINHPNSGCQGLTGRPKSSGDICSPPAGFLHQLHGIGLASISQWWRSHRWRV